ncbi:hypothetical protein DYB32_009285 [Aphanomyces invadans]|uniref:FYVE-type domain-containing protein n=1 Tax=Aphanomyces invadans TaxID=157072 RepID=A0A3R7A359_9STRA|nr:hypothetical protein DYB32_009285 [Aphanomyces invadans]
MVARKLQLPLPAGFFRTPPLTNDEQLAYTRQGERALHALVRASRVHGGPIAWKFAFESHGVAVYRGFFDNAAAQLRITEVQATLEEAALLVGVGDDGSHDYCATHNPDHIVDFQTLYNVAAPGRHHPHKSLTIKWRAMASPFLATRDFCFLECQDDFTIDGMVGFARCLQSIDVPSVCPKLERSFGLVRGDIRLGGDVFFKSRRPGYITVCRLYDVDLKGHAWMNSRHLYARSTLTKGMLALDNQFRQQRMNHSAYLPEYTLVPRHTRSHCAVCHCKLSTPVVGKKFNCHKCGEVVCRRCHGAFYMPDYHYAGYGGDTGRLTTLFKSQGRRTSLWSMPTMSFVMFRVCDVCSSTPLALPAPGGGIECHGGYGMDDVLSTLRSTWQVAPPTNVDPSTTIVTVSCRDVQAHAIMTSQPYAPRTARGPSCVGAFDDDIPIMMSCATVDMLEEPTPRSHLTHYSTPSHAVLEHGRPPSQHRAIPPSRLGELKQTLQKWTDQVEQADGCVDTARAVSTAATADDDDWTTPPPGSDTGM